MEAKKPLKYLGYAIVCEEVPDEITIAFNVSGCEHRCEGCHSSFLWEYTGHYIKDDLDEIIQKYNGLVTCVCFLGGDQNIEELARLCRVVKEKNLKTCIYSGDDSIEEFLDIISCGLIDYLKIGRYISKLGGLNSANTNQKMYAICDGILNDITYKFQKRLN